MACITLGSDTGGSIRQPASFCGVVGVKPTYGMVSRYGVVAFGSSLDQVGPVHAKRRRRRLCDGRPVRLRFARLHLAAFHAAFRGRAFPRRRRHEGGHRPRLHGCAGPDRRGEGEGYETAAKLEAAGAELVEVELPHADAAISAYYVLGPCEAFSNLARFDAVRYGYCEDGHKDLNSQYEGSRAGGFGMEAKRRIMLGSYLLSSGVYEKYYYPAQQVRRLITQDYVQAYEKCDVILAPTSPRTAFRFGEIGDPVEMHLSDIYTVSINIAGNGGMSVPCGLGSESGLPIGVQLVSPQFKDVNMFRAAAALEAVYGAAPVAPAFKAGE